MIMKQHLLIIAIGLTFTACSNNTGSSTGSATDTVKKNDSAPGMSTDTVYPQTDTNSFRQDRSKIKDTAK